MLISGSILIWSMFTMFRLIRSMDWPRVDCEIKKSCTVPSFKWDESDLAGTKLILEYQYKYNGINLLNLKDIQINQKRKLNHNDQ